MTDTKSRTKNEETKGKGEKGAPGRGTQRRRPKKATAAPARPAAPEMTSSSALLAADEEGFADEVELVLDFVVLVVRPDAPVGVTAAVGPAIGAVVVPEISASTEALNEPVMPVMVKREENARAGKVGLVASARAKDWNRMKYMSPLVPSAGLTVNWMASVDETLTLVVMLCTMVCCRAFPT